MDILSLLKNNIPLIKKKYGVKKIGIFGSVVRGDAKEASDVDVLVEFKKDKINFDNFMDLGFFLEDLFRKKVDLITVGGLDKYIRPYVEKEVVWCEKR
ncbi:MAG: nucleotidyltransferase family protein [Candidatus Methanoperedens sp.]